MAGTQISSMLRAAQSERNKRVQLEDDIAAYKWANSEQNQSDYEEYRRHLDTRMSQTSDPAKMLTLQNKADAARRSFSSNEIQRVAINVLEGTATLEDKKATVLALYHDAVANQDFNLVQNLRNTYDSIDVAIQRKQEADAQRMAGYAEKMARANVTSLQELADSYLSGDDPNSPDMSNKQVADSFKKYGTDFMNDTGTVNGVTYNMWDKVFTNTRNAIDALTEAANVAYAAGQDSRGDSLYEKALKLNNGESKIQFAGLNLTLDEINNARDAARNGQNYFQPAKDASGNNILRKNKVTNYMWGRDVNGNLRIVQTMNEVGNTYTARKKDDKGKEIAGTSVEDRLKAAGYEVEGVDSESGLLRIRDTNSSRGRNADANSSLGESYLVSVDPQTGNLRYVGERGDGTGQSIYEINLADPNAPDFGTSREIDANAETFFGNKDINSVANDQGVAYINKLLEPNIRNSVDAVLQGAGENLSGGKVGVFDGNFAQFYTGDPISGVVQGAAIKKNEIADRLQAAAALTVQQAAPINITVDPQSQGGNIGNINQLPVPANARLSVAKPTPTPKVVVAPPVAPPKVAVAQPNTTPKIGGVSVAPTSGVKLKVL